MEPKFFQKIEKRILTLNWPFGKSNNWKIGVSEMGIFNAWQYSHCWNFTKLNIASLDHDSKTPCFFGEVYFNQGTGI